MFNKQPSSPQGAAAPPRPSQEPSRAGSGTDSNSVIGKDMRIEGNVGGQGELRIDGVVKGDVRMERVIVGDAGQVDGAIHAEAVEVRGKVTGSITAKQVRLFGACHVDGDITHEQLAMETGAFFQGRSLRLQRATPATPAATPSPPPETPAAPAKP